LEEKEKFYITSKYANIEISPFCSPLKNCNSLIITLYVFLKWWGVASISAYVENIFIGLENK
jgi:hypothetical protein